MPVISATNNLYTLRSVPEALSVPVLAEFSMPKLSMCVIHLGELLAPAQAHARTKWVHLSRGQIPVWGPYTVIEPYYVPVTAAQAGIQQETESLFSRSLHSSWCICLQSFCSNQCGFFGLFVTDSSSISRTLTV